MDDGTVSIDDVVEGAVLEILALVGTKERAGTPNSGDVVDLILASVGQPPGKEWCAATVFYSFMRSAAKLHTVNPCPRKAGCLRMLEAASSYHRTKFARRGCIYILDKGGGKGHAGIVTADDGAGNVVDQVSGNTNEAGSRTGNAVAMHHGPPWLKHGGKLAGYIDFRLPAPA